MNEMNEMMSPEGRRIDREMQALGFPSILPRIGKVLTADDLEKLILKIHGPEKVKLKLIIGDKK